MPDHERYIGYQSRIFEFVEVYLNSTTDRLTFRNWTKQAPDDFRMTLRIPQAITQSNDTERHGQFLERDVNPLGEKVLALVIQLSTRISIKNGKEWLN
jgi:uncharacterized protein YecE (DUF72 family)